MPGIFSDKVIILSKFRGSLVGALLGDCLGAPYEGDETVSKIILQRYFDKMEDPTFKCMPFSLQYEITVVLYYYHL